LLTDTLNNENQEHYTTCVQQGNGLSLTFHPDEFSPKILFSFPASLLRSTFPAYPVCFYRFNNSSSKWYVKKKKFEFESVQANHRPIAFWMSLTNRGWIVEGFILFPLMVYLME
jgi:hypothetical protein